MVPTQPHDPARPAWIYGAEGKSRQDFGRQIWLASFENVEIFCLKQILTAAVMNCLADISAQYISKITQQGQSKRFSCDFISVLRMGFWAIICTPLIDIW